MDPPTTIMHGALHALATMPIDRSAIPMYPSMMPSDHPSIPDRPIRKSLRNPLEIPMTKVLSHLYNRFSFYS